MEDLTIRMASEMPSVAAILIVFWVLRADVLSQLEWLRSLIEELIEKLDDDVSPP